mgnify:CR=1 FL=1
MRGISKEKADQNAIRYRGIYEKWQTEESITLEQLGKEHEVTKQRMWQIITRCKLGNGDYYYGVNVDKDKKQTRLAFNEWLENNQIKLIGNNKTTAPHTGWDLL